MLYDRTRPVKVQYVRRQNSHTNVLRSHDSDYLHYFLTKERVENQIAPTNMEARETKP